MKHAFLSFLLAVFEHSLAYLIKYVCEKIKTAEANDYLKVFYHLCEAKRNIATVTDVHEDDFSIKS